MDKKRTLNEPQSPQRPNEFKFSPLLAALIAILLFNYLIFNRGVESLPYSEFLKLLDEDKIASVTISEPTITGELKTTSAEGPSRFSTLIVNNDNIAERLHAKKVPFRSEVKSPLWGILISWILPFAILYALWSFAASRMTKIAPGGGIFSMAKAKAKIFMEKEVKTTFADVAGVDEAKQELQEAVSFLQDPKRFSRLGGRLPKGILLVGPPGTGKTLLARAVAGEAKVPFFSINGSEFVELFVGLGAARVRDLFEQARKQAPCILFIDEIDALGKSRAFGMAGIGTNDEKEQTLNQLLAEMDGFDSSEGVIMLAATNRPEILDPALLRAGRFDRQVLLTNPDHAGRLQILQVHTKKIKIDSAIDLNRVASFTSGFSGADLANLVNEAALVATRRNADFVTEDDFSKAVERIVAGLEQKTKVMSSTEKNRIAFHELGHTTVSLALDGIDKVHKVSIIPRGIGSLGYTLQRPTEDRYVLVEKELLNKIAVLMGGRASEKMHLGEISTGAADDLLKATEMARAMVTQFGMSKRIGLASLEGKSARYLQSTYEFTPRLLSEQTIAEVDSEVKSILENAFQKAMKYLEINSNFIKEASQRLLKSETLDENEINELWQKFGQKKEVNTRLS